MPKTCGVTGCKARGGRGFFRIPNAISNKKSAFTKSYNQQLQDRQNAWMKAINRPDLMVNKEKLTSFLKFQCVCSRHFVSGQSAKLKDTDNVDWVPTLHMNDTKTKSQKKKQIEPLAVYINDDVLKEEISDDSEILIIPKSKAQVAINSKRISVAPSTSSDINTTFKCNFCPQQYYSYVGVYSHMLANHKDSREVEKKDAPNTMPMVYICHFCTRDYKSISLLATHMEKVHPEKLKQVLPKTATIYECGTCAEHFPSLEIVNAHISQVHSTSEKMGTAKIPSTLFECGFCSRQFNAIGTINAHIDQYHNTNETRVVRCLICKTAFLTPDDLKVHMSVVHPMKCENKSSIVGNHMATKQKNQQTLKELFERLENFDWCACNRCVLYCKLFFDHLRENHETKTSVKTKQTAISTVTSPVETVQPESKLMHDHTYFADDYFENTQINLTFPKKPSPDMNKESVIKVEAKLTNYPSMANTKKKVFFKIRKEGDTKVFICTVCKSTIKDHAQLLGHFKMHLMKRQLSKTEVAQNKKLPKPIVQGNLNIMATILGAEMKPVKSVIEYQCSVCAEVLSSRVLALRCLRRHVDNGWPVDLDIGVVWENLTKENELTSVYFEKDQEMVESQDIEIAGEMTVDNPDSETHLQSIASKHTEQSGAHTLTYNDPICYQCKPCKLYYDCREELQKHLIESHDGSNITQENEASIPYTIKCALCHEDQGQNVVFDTIQEAMLHRHREHFYSIDHSPAHPVSRFIVKPDETEIPVEGKMLYYRKNCIVEEFQCVCDKVYNFKSLAVKCLAKHVGIRRFKCLKNHVINPGKCGIQFYSALDLENHDKRVHQPGNRSKSVVCHLCGISLYNSNIKKHMRLKHMAIVPQTCPTCGKAYTSAFRLNIHIRNVHQKEKRHRCDVCFKKYVWKSAADKCEAIHTGDRNVKCEYCNKWFYTVSQKVSHRVVAHPKVTEMLCDHCDFIGQTLRQLKQHYDAEHYFEQGDSD